MAGNKNLGDAKMNKNDEFYTLLEDIEKEMKHYKKQFENKIVFCNCDDPYESNFFKYFALNFNLLKLKKLICTCYAGSPIVYEQLSLLDIEPLKIKKITPNKAYKIEITDVSDSNGDGAIDLLDIEHLLKNNKNTLTLLKGDGDFRSEECVKLLKEADIVVTNPPFSLFREYITQLMKYKKKFLVLSNMNALHYKEVFPLIQENKIWIGYGFNLSMVYKTPYPNLLEANRKFVIGKGYDPDEGYVKVPGICWFTNLDVDIRHEKMILYKKYNEQEYPKYVNYDAIDVNKVSDIPVDYYGSMGVPDTFINQYNPEQFKIIGYGRGDFIEDIGYVPKKFLDDYHAIGGKGHITSGMKTLCFYDNSGKPCFPYSRIIIQKLKAEEDKNGD